MPPADVVAEFERELDDYAKKLAEAFRKHVESLKNSPEEERRLLALAAKLEKKKQSASKLRNN